MNLQTYRIITILIAVLACLFILFISSNHANSEVKVEWIINPTERDIRHFQECSVYLHIALQQCGSYEITLRDIPDEYTIKLGVENKCYLYKNGRLYGVSEVYDEDSECYDSLDKYIIYKSNSKCRAYQKL
jgi:hypothetical protein